MDMGVFDIATKIDKLKLERDAADKKRIEATVKYDKASSDFDLLNAMLGTYDDRVERYLDEAFIILKDAEEEKKKADIDFYAVEEVYNNS